MDAPSDHLKSQCLSLQDVMHVPPDQLEKIRLVEATPEYQALKRQGLDATVQLMTLHSKSGKFGSAGWSRDGTEVTIDWKIGRGLAPRNFKVAVGIMEIFLHPSVDTLSSNLVAYETGDGEVTLDLEEGRCYFITFKFMRGDLNLSKDVSEDVDTFHLHVGIPLSSENKDLFEKADSGSRVAAHVKTEVGAFVEIDTTFDEALEEGINLIKSRRLPPEKESERIEHLNEFIAFLREKMRH